MLTPDASTIVTVNLLAKGRAPGPEGRYVERKVPMSVEQSDVVDIISVDRESGDVVLTISDHLDWLDSLKHQALLQVKLNKYLTFVESGEILERYPNAKGKSGLRNRAQIQA